jgi:hypothetical protein
LIFEFAGESQIGYHIKPLDPKTISSVVRYGKMRYPLMHEATGYSLVYSQLYPFEGLQNYTSGIIHHVRLTGIILFSLNNLDLIFQCSIHFGQHIF